MGAHILGRRSTAEYSVSGWGLYTNLTGGCDVEFGNLCGVYANGLSVGCRSSYRFDVAGFFGGARPVVVDLFSGPCGELEHSIICGVLACAAGFTHSIFRAAG